MPGVQKPRLKTVHVCSECGHVSPKWEGRCPECEAWNSYVEEVQRPAHRAVSATIPVAPARASLLEDVDADRQPRMAVGISELERVLGGGLVRGSLVLMSGDPGIGKSTLLLQLCAALPVGETCLYVSGEESLEQLKMRLDRLGLRAPALQAMASNDLGEVIGELDRNRPSVVVVDSVQTISEAGLDSAPGSVVQVREVAARVMSFCKATGVAAFLVGHVNKEGAIAGPRVLEHMVDAVLYLEGETAGQLRLLRSHKNRFGSTDELGIFEMSERGLVECADPARAFYDDASLGAAGTAVFPAIEGSRPLLVEIQSLVSPTPFGLPRRSATGVDLNRLHMLLAVLEKRAGCPVANQDVYVNVVGGVRLQEPSADLALALSVVSNLRDRPLAPGLVVVGELGLAGEIREGRRLERRLTEAARLGFSQAIVGRRGPGELTVPGIRTRSVGNLREAIAAAFD